MMTKNQQTISNIQLYHSAVETQKQPPGGKPSGGPEAGNVKRELPAVAGICET